MQDQAARLANAVASLQQVENALSGLNSRLNTPSPHPAAAVTGLPEWVHSTLQQTRMMKASLEKELRADRGGTT
jgi:hypothetical protein